jgi:hypothetical protein
MNRFSHLLVAVVALLLAAVPALADGTVITQKSTGLSVTLPEDWKTKTEGDLIESASPDDLCQMLIFKVDPDNLDAALGAIDSALTDLGELKFEGEPEKMTVNELPAVTVQGTAKVKDAKVHVAAAVVDAGEHCLVVLVFGGDEALAKHADATRGIFHSVKKKD